MDFFFPIWLTAHAQHKMSHRVLATKFQGLLHKLCLIRGPRNEVNEALPCIQWNYDTSKPSWKWAITAFLQAPTLPGKLSPGDHSCFPRWHKGMTPHVVHCSSICRSEELLAHELSKACKIINSGPATTTTGKNQNSSYNGLIFLTFNMEYFTNLCVILTQGSC